MSSSSSSEFDDRPIKVIIKKKKKVVIREEIEPNKDNRYCNVENCKEKKHGRFDECKDHFMKRHRKGSNFKWSPPEVGYKTIMDILECYPHVYSFDQIKISHIDDNSRSKIPISCMKCGYKWEPTISKIINGGTGCPDCLGTIRWNLERFQQRIYNINVNIDISRVKAEDIINHKSQILVSCVICNYIWETSINSLVCGSGCRKCSGKLPWSLARFKEAMINRTEININRVTEEHIKNGESKIPLSCNICNYEWSPILSIFIDKKSRCPSCIGNVQYNLERFTAKMVNRPEINISGVKEEHIRGSKIKIPISCNICYYEWESNIYNMISGKTGCPKCSGNARYNLAMFLDKIKDRNDIDVSEVKEKHIKNNSSRIPITCKKCNFKWTPQIACLVTGTGCPKCKNSKGIRCLEEHLNFLNIGFEIEKKFKNLHLEDKLRVDIYIPKMEGIKYPIFLEFDGDFPGSHFSYRNDREKARHVLTVKRDKIKDKYAMNNKMHVIRIPYTCFPKNSEEKLKETLEEALEILKTKKKPYLCLMDEELYRRRDENLLEE